MLKYRILTAVLLIPLVFSLIFFAPYQVFAFAAALLLVGASWEWCTLIGLQKLFHRILYMTGLLLIAIGSYYLLPVSLLFYFALVCWCFFLFFIIHFPKGQRFWMKHLSLRVGLGALLLIPFIEALLYIKLQQDGATWLMLILLMVWAADTGAYFTGRKFGKIKLIPNVSPNKTREGLYGGIGLSMFVVFIFGLLTKNPIFLEPYFILGLFLCVIFAVVGDLMESAIKRFANVKDSGNILPGHGGLLDRIDSLIAALPIFALTLWLFG